MAAYSEILRDKMVKTQIAARGVEDRRVLQAMQDVPRHEFVDEEHVESAYLDKPLPIGEGQTISQPYMVALMLEQLELTPTSRVLEVGAGSGYAAAVLAKLAAEVYTIERHATLARTAEERLKRLGFSNITVFHRDGTLGLREHAPFDAIVVAASGPQVPDSLKYQLAFGGRLLIPTGTSKSQALILVTRIGADEFRETRLCAVRFVPLIGEHGH